jgi:DNA-binding CsgD family transcriptional regulator
VRAVDTRVPPPTGVPVVTVRGGEGSVDIAERAIVVGRDADCDLSPTGRGLSRRHAKLVRGIDNRITIVDLGSTNGTFVDGMRVEVCAISPASHVQLGSEVVLELSYRRAAPPDALDVGLTPRELEIGRLVGEGATNQEIADRLGIARRTVTTHVSRIFDKVGVGSRLELIRRLRGG